jgi:hypothetical protein
VQLGGDVVLPLLFGPAEHIGDLLSRCRPRRASPRHACPLGRGVRRRSGSAARMRSTASCACRPRWMRSSTAEWRSSPAGGAGGFLGFRMLLLCSGISQQKSTIFSGFYFCCEVLDI